MFMSPMLVIMADEKAQLQELTQFINASFQVEIKGVALDYIAGLTATENGCDLIRNANGLIPNLVKLLIEDDIEEIKRDCMRILINLITDPGKSSSFGLLEEDVLYFFIKYVLNQESKYADDAAKLLSNLTRSEGNCKRIFDYIDKLNSTSLADFVDAFCIQGYNKKNNQLSYLGSFLSNMTLIENARRLFLDKERCVIQRLLPYTTHKESRTRRAAVVRIIKNSSFETGYHDWLLSSDVDILPHLLLPLAGPEEFHEDEMEKLPTDLQYLPEDKEREPDEEIRVMLIETLLQLCSRKVGREYLKDNGAYYIMRELHQVEKNEDVNIAVEKLIQILIGDEPDEDMEDLKSVDIPKDVQQKFEAVDAQEQQNQDKEQ